MIDISMLMSASIGSAALGGGVGAGVFAVFKDTISNRLKSAIQHEYDAKLESIKAQLKADSDVQLERQKHQLQMNAKEHEVKFERLQEKRGEIIAETYSRLDTIYGILLLIQDDKSDVDNDTFFEKQITPFVEKLSAFIVKLRTDKIYFPATVVSALNTITSDMIDESRRMLSSRDKAEVRNEDFLPQIASVERGMDALANEMRKLLGVED